MIAVIEPTTTQPAEKSAEAWAVVERAQAGDPNAFAEIYRAEYDRVYRFIARKVRNLILAEDLAHDVFLRALCHIGSVTWQGHGIGAWLRTVAYNRVVDHCNSARVRLERPSDDPFGNPHAADESREGHPDQLAVDNLTGETVQAALRDLPPAQRQVLTLRFLRGLSVAETAAAMNRTESAVKNLQHRATRALRELLPYGFEEDR